MSQVPSIDLLLNLVPERPEVVLEKLRAHPELVAKQDVHGYSLVHAAASYGHEDLLKALITEFNADVNIRDEDAETALFNVEEVRMAKVLVELGIDKDLPNNEGQTAQQKLSDEDEQPEVAAYLLSLSTGTNTSSTSAGQPAHEANGVQRPPPLPNGLQLNVGTMNAGDAGDEPDPEFRRRIEELASNPDFQGEAGQEELRRLVHDAISGLTDQSDAPPASRRRVD